MNVDGELGGNIRTIAENVEAINPTCNRITMLNVHVGQLQNLLLPSDILDMSPHLKKMQPWTAAEEVAKSARRCEPIQ